MAIPPALRRRLRSASLPLLLVFAYLLSAAWSIATPVPNIDTSTGVEWGNFHPDECSHTSIVRYMAQWRTIPPYGRQYYLADHPPLYHGLAAIVYAICAPSLGYDHTMLALRLLTAFCGVGIVYLTYQATRRVAPHSTALFAAALVALLPMRVSLNGAITNENLAALGAAGALATMVGGLSDRCRGFTAHQIALLALYLVIGMGSKVTCLGLLPVAGLALYVKARSMRAPISTAAWPFLLLTVAIAACWGWWFVRNQVLYGDPLCKAAADRVWDEAEPGFSGFAVHAFYAPALYAFRVAAIAWRSFWGQFDGMQRPLPTFVYAVVAALQTAATAGLWQLWKKRKLSARITAVFMIFTVFAAYVVAVFSLYNWRHYTPQGRYFFVLLLPFGLLTALGWKAIIPPAIRRGLTSALLIFLALLNLYLLYVIPRRLAYTLRLPIETKWTPARP